MYLREDNAAAGGLELLALLPLQLARVALLGQQPPQALRRLVEAVLQLRIKPRSAQGQHKVSTRSSTRSAQGQHKVSTTSAQGQHKVSTTPAQGVVQRGALGGTSRG